MVLRGQLVTCEPGQLRMRLRAGVVRVDTGPWPGSLALETGSTIEVVAAKHQEEGCQRFLAREYRHAGGTAILRDPTGVLRSLTRP